MALPAAAVCNRGESYRPRTFYSGYKQAVAGASGGYLGRL